MTAGTLEEHQKALVSKLAEQEAALLSSGHEPDKLEGYADLVGTMVVLRIEYLYRKFVRRELKRLRKHPTRYRPGSFVQEVLADKPEIILFKARGCEELVPKFIKGERREWEDGNYAHLLDKVVQNLNDTEALHGLRLKVVDAPGWTEDDFIIIVNTNPAT